MADHIRTHLTTPQGPQQPMITAWLLVSSRNIPLRMAGHRMATASIVQAAILIGPIGLTLTSPLMWLSG